MIEDRPRTPLRWPELAWLAVVLVASSALVIQTSRSIGPTFDEPFYITKGLDFWRTGSAKPLMRAGTMPLPVDVQTLPLHLWEWHRGEPFDTVEQLDELLPVARLMTLPFWWLLLASGFRLARRWGGPASAGIAVGLLGFEPNLIAHAALAATDIALTAGVLAAADAFVAGLGRGWARRILLPGLWAGFAMLCKASAVTFVPILFAVVLWRHGQLRRVARDGLRIGLIAAVVVFGYVGSDWTVEPSFVKWANTLPDGHLGDGVRAVANNLRVFPNAAEGVIQQIKHNIRGHGVYSLGGYHHRAVWYYFPVVLSQKLTLPVLVLLTVAALRGGRRVATEVRELRCGRASPGDENVTRRRAKSGHTPPTPSWPSLPALIALALLLFSLTCRVQIGVRLVFPLVGFLILAASVGAGRRIGWFAVLASVVIAFLSAPHGLRYQNELWGGTARSGETQTDSNCDWGQGVPELRAWWQSAGEPPLTVWYYGTDPNAFRPPFRPLPLHVLPDRSPEFVRRASAGGYFAVGRTFLTACPDRRPETLALIAWLNARPPVAEVGCFAVYDLRE